MMIQFASVTDAKLVWLSFRLSSVSFSVREGALPGELADVIAPHRAVALASTGFLCMSLPDYLAGR